MMFNNMNRDRHALPRVGGPRTDLHTIILDLQSSDLYTNPRPLVPVDTHPSLRPHPSAHQTSRLQRS
jgi:hypothetical protein